MGHGVCSASGTHPRPPPQRGPLPRTPLLDCAQLQTAREGARGSFPGCSVPQAHVPRGAAAVAVPPGLSVACSVRNGVPVRP